MSSSSVSVEKVIYHQILPSGYFDVIEPLLYKKNFGYFFWKISLNTKSVIGVTNNNTVLNYYSYYV